MEIKIKAEGTEKEIDVVFANDNLDNYNFVDVIIDGNEYMFSIDDLDEAINSFIYIRDKSREEDRESKATFPLGN